MATLSGMSTEPGMDRHSTEPSFMWKSKTSEILGRQSWKFSLKTFASP
ncbi:hypothetical protein M096_4359 [Parabacteroides distasonis str. 3999B T(B) 6]|nr:hypothetical protein M096_4359 [Parabacteroides distasonis str. 3999B T(B) 6]